MAAVQWSQEWGWGKTHPPSCALLVAVLDHCHSVVNRETEAPGCQETYWQNAMVYRRIALSLLRHHRAIRG